MTTLGQGLDRAAARQLESAANLVSGLALEEIQEDGHAIANRLWKVAAYLKRRSYDDKPPAG